MDKTEEANREELNREKRPVQKEMVKKNGSKRQKITSQEVLRVIQSNRDERLEKQGRLLKAVETKKVEENAIDAFFKSIAISVKQLSPSSQVKAKVEICRIVSDLELMELGQSLPHMPVPTQPSTNFSVHSTCPTESPASTYNITAVNSDIS